MPHHITTSCIKPHVFHDDTSTLSALCVGIGSQQTMLYLHRKENQEFDQSVRCKYCTVAGLGDIYDVGLVFYSMVWDDVFARVVWLSTQVRSRVIVLSPLSPRYLTSFVA